MKSFQIAGLPPDELTSFLTGTHSDPFRVLGPHRVGDDLEIRVFRPDARKIDIVLNQQATGPIAAEKIHRDGFFCATVPGGTDGDRGSLNPQVALLEREQPGRSPVTPSLQSALAASGYVGFWETDLATQTVAMTGTRTLAAKLHPSPIPHCDF